MNIKNLKGASPLVGGLIGLTSLAGTIPQYGFMQDGSFDPVSGMGAFTGGLAGGGAGYLAGRTALSGLAKKVGNVNTGNSFKSIIEKLNPGALEANKGLFAKEELSGLTKMYSKNPGLASLLPGLGGGLGVLLGSQIVGSALKGPREAQLSQQQAY